MNNGHWESGIENTMDGIALYTFAAKIIDLMHDVTLSKQYTHLKSSFLGPPRIKQLPAPTANQPVIITFSKSMLDGICWKGISLQLKAIFKHHMLFARITRAVA